MTACSACGRQCIPMADYDLPTCIACDAQMDAPNLMVDQRKVQQRTEQRARLLADLEAERAAVREATAWAALYAHEAAMADARRCWAAARTLRPFITAGAA